MASIDAPKILEQIAKILGVEKVSANGLHKALEAMLLLASPEDEPAEEHEADPEMPPEMACKPEMQAQPQGDVVSAAVPPTSEQAQAEQTQGPPSDGSQDAARIDVSKAIEQLSGLDPTALLAAIAEKGDALAALFGAAAAAPPAEQANALEDVRTVADARLAAMSRQLETRDETIAKLEAELDGHRTAALERKIDDAISAGRVLDRDRERLVKLAKRAPECLTDWIDGPAVVPTAQLTRPAPVSPTTGNQAPSIDADHPLARMLEIQLSRVVLDPVERQRIIGDRLRSLTK